MLLLLALAGLVSFGLPSSFLHALGQESAADADDRERVRELLLILDDPASSLAERRAAEGELIEMGPKVLPWFGPVETASAVESLTRVRREIESSLARSVVEASRVSLPSGITISEALQLVEEQTGNRFAGIDGQSDLWTETIDDADYWPVMDRLLDAAVLSPSRFVNEDSITRLVARDEQAPDRAGRGFYQGPFRIETLRVASAIDLRSSDRSRLTVELELAWEPRLRVIRIQMPAENLSARDDAGRVISPSPFARQINGRVQPAVPRSELTLPFELPDSNARSIKSLEANVNCLILGRIEEFEFALLDSDGRALTTDNDRTQRKGDAEVRLLRVTRDDDRHSVDLSVRFDDASDSLESHQDWIFRNPAYLIDANGKRWEPTRRETLDQATHEVESRFFFDPSIDLRGSRFVYQSPTAVVEHLLTFTLEEVPLP